MTALPTTLTLFNKTQKSKTDEPYFKTSVYLSSLKRTAIILFTALYLLTTSGIMIGQHLCMGRVKETTLFKKVDKQCGMSIEMHKDMEGCCDNELLLKKVEDDQQISVAKDLPLAEYHLLYEIPFNEFVTSIISEEKVVEVKNTGPPDIPMPGLFILYHSLKIPFVLQS